MLFSLTNNKIFGIVAFPIGFLLNLRWFFIFCGELIQEVVCALKIFCWKAICFSRCKVFGLNLLFQIKLFYDVGGWWIFNFWRSYLIRTAKKCWSCHVFDNFFLLFFMFFHLIGLVIIKFWSGNTLIEHFFFVLVFLRFFCNWVMLVWSWKGASWVIFWDQSLVFLIFLVSIIHIEGSSFFDIWTIIISGRVGCWWFD